MSELMREGSLGSILFMSQIISEDDIRAALDEQQKCGCRFGEALVRLGIVTQEDIDWALANQLNIPYVRLKKEMIDRAAVELVPASLARQHGLMPLIRVGDELSIAMIDPLNKEAIAAVEQQSGCRVAVSVALIREMREMHELFYGPPETAESLGFASAFFPPDALAKINADLTGSKLIDYVLIYLVQQKLSSLSLQPVGDVFRVIARKGGVSREIGIFPRAGSGQIFQRLRRLSGIDGCSPERGRIVFHFRGKELTFETLVLGGAGGDFVTIRLQVLSPFPPTIGEFGAPAEVVAAFRGLTTLSRGLVLCASHDATDRDRLVDLYLDELETAGRGVMLFGEGVGRGRKRFPRVPRQELAAGEFAALVMAGMDHDPDVIAIDDAGEEQILLAAGKVAMRGRLAAAGVPFHDLAVLFRYLGHLWHRHHFIPAYLKGIVACRGILLLCPDCRQEYVPNPDELAALGLKELPSRFWTSAGCHACDYTGVRSRRYLLEVIPVTAALIARLGASHDGRDVLRFLQDEGHRGIMAQGEELLKRGEISPAEYISSLVL
jgi:type II secretory ATPase GspE/PulE/Tfp pilus assembly ATPase PilB-like protein